VRFATVFYVKLIIMCCSCVAAVVMARTSGGVLWNAPTAARSDERPVCRGQRMVDGHSTAEGVAWSDNRRYEEASSIVRRREHLASGSCLHGVEVATADTRYVVL
jgi:hypothetical protein